MITDRAFVVWNWTDLSTAGVLSFKTMCYGYIPVVIQNDLTSAFSTLFGLNRISFEVAITT